MTAIAETIRTPLDAVAFFTSAIPDDLGFLAQRTPPASASVLEDVPPFFAPESEFALALTPEEQRSAAIASVALVMHFDEATPSPERLDACVDHILKCHELGALAIALPAARRVVGRSALEALAPALSDRRNFVKLFVQLHVIQDERHAWTHTHGMAHYGLPDLECRTALGERGLAERLLDAAMSRLLEHGAESLQSGSLVEATEPDGRFLARFRVYPARAVEGHAYDAWGALQIVPLPASAEQPSTVEPYSMDVRSHVKSLISGKQRARDLDMRGVDFTGVDLSHFKADRVDFSHGDLTGATLRDARLGGCRLHGAMLEGADWSGATLRTCALDDARGRGTRFDGARLEDSSATGADFTGASMYAAKLTETSFERAVLREAILDRAEGEGVRFRGADLSGATLIGARFDDADFRGADLQRANLSRGRFHDADFRGAVLDGTRFDDADCSGALFDAGAGPRTETASTADATTTQPSPEEWRPWLEQLLAMAQGGRPADLQALLAAGGAPTAELVERLEHWVRALEANPDQPPEAWKPWLEPLLATTNKGQAPDLKSLLDALSALTHARPPAKEDSGGATVRPL